MNRAKIFLFLLVFLNCSFSGFTHNLSQVDSLLKSLSQQSPKIQVTKLIEASANYRGESYVKSTEIGKYAIDIARKSKQSDLRALALKNQGINYIYQGELDSALNYFSSALPLLKAAGLRKDLGRTLSNMGVAYRRLGMYDKALEKYLENLKIYEEIGYTKGLGSLYLNIGGLYQQQGKLNMAEKHFKRALEIAEEIEHNVLMARAFNNLGVIYEGRKKLDQSLEYYEEALYCLEDEENTHLDAIISMNIGFIYYLKGEYERAMDHYNKAELIRTQLSDNWGLVKVWVLQGKNYYQMGKHRQALNSMKKAEKSARNLNLFFVLSEIYQELSYFYEDQKDYSLALKYNKEAVSLADSLHNETNRKELGALEKKYEAAKRKKDLALLEQKNQIQLLELSRKNAWLFGLVIMIVFGVVVISVSFHINRMRTQQRNMALQQRVLLSQMNPHFIFNSLTAIQSFILDERNDEANCYLSELASLIRSVLENSRQDFVPLRNELQVLHEYMSLQNLRFEDRLECSFEIDPDIDVDDIAVPPMLAQPFIENSIKHGQLLKNDKPLIYVKICSNGDNDTLLFEITDNGVGIDHSQAETKDPSHCSLATSIALDRVKIYNYRQPDRMKFEIIDLKHVDPTLNGTRVTFHLPFRRV